MPLTYEEEYRYSRHLVLPGVGAAGQERLKRGRVLLVGAGGLGSAAALYLAAAGVGTLGIADGDSVEVSNLQRQVLHRSVDAGRPKVDSAVDTLRALNPLVTVRPIRERVTAANAMALVGDYDLVIDGTDNFPARYLLNDACALHGKPLVFGSIFRFEGQAAVFDAPRGPCYRCLFPEPPPPESVPTCAEGGVLGVLPGLVGTVQAMEALKLLLETGEPLRGRMLLIDALVMRFREIQLTRNPACSLCGDAPTITALTDLDEYCGLTPSDGTEIEISADVLRARMAVGTVDLVDVREAWEQDEIPGLPGARALPYPLFARRMTELDSAAEIVLYCSAGARSWQAAAMLRRAGFTRAWSLRGGLRSIRENEATASEVESARISS